MSFFHLVADQLPDTRGNDADRKLRTHPGDKHNDHAGHERHDSAFKPSLAVLGRETHLNELMHQLRLTRKLLANSDTSLLLPTHVGRARYGDDAEYKVADLTGPVELDKSRFAL
jgi:hypothetical protein